MNYICNKAKRSFDSQLQAAKSSVELGSKIRKKSVEGRYMDSSEYKLFFYLPLTLKVNCKDNSISKTTKFTKYRYCGYSSVSY